jgi:hypothetical protein
LRIRAIQETVFSVANADFEVGDDDGHVVTAIALFWSFMLNSAIAVLAPPLLYGYPGGEVHHVLRSTWCTSPKSRLRTIV